MNYYLAVILAGFLLGSMPWGLWMGHLLGKGDIRNLGSGNLGATNVYRTMGPWAALLVLLLDAGKGWIATAIVPGLLPGSESWPYLRLVGGLAAMTGHILTPFASFKGGKGVATSLGVFIGLAPIPTAISFGAFVVFVAATGFVSLGSMIAAVVLPLAIYLTRATVQHQWGAVLVLAVISATLILVRHRSNLKRLMAGTESPLWKKKGPKA
jgi:glycerol-3-phosphate acyltransferase PlsY